MLGELLIVGSVVAAGAAIERAFNRYNQRRHRELVEAWRRTAQRLGLTLEVSRELRMSGMIGTIAVRAETAYEGGNHGLGEVTRFQLEDASRVPLTFRMRRRARSGWLLGEIETSGMPTGDPYLDALAVIRGNEVRLAAILNQKTRDLIKLAVGIHGAAIGYGRITHRELAHVRSERRLVGVLHMLRDVAHALAIEDEAIPRALYANLSDPLPGVRRRNFQLLFEYFPESREAQLALPVAAADPDPVVRLSAALGRGADGVSDIVAAIDDAELSVSIKLYAIRQLALRYRGSAVDQTLTKLLASANDRLVSAALRAIAASQKRELLPQVINLLRAAARSEDVLVDAISAVGAIGEVSVERDLVALLRNSLLRVRIAAAYSLGGLGTLASIEHLIECSSGLFAHRALKETARRSIRRIQDRFYAAGAGLLSLVEEEERGEVSLADADGALSLERSG